MSSQDHLLRAEQEVARGNLALARHHLQQAVAGDLSAEDAVRLKQLQAQAVHQDSEFTDRHRAQSGWPVCLPDC